MIDNLTPLPPLSASDRLQILLKRVNAWIDESDDSCVCLVYHNKVIYRYPVNISPSIIYTDLLDYLEGK